MPRSYSGDLRERVIEVVKMEGASRREAAERFDISASFRGQMAAALEQEPECQAEAARRKRVSVGSAQGVDIGSRCRTAGPDLEGDACEACSSGGFEPARARLLRF